MASESDPLWVYADEDKKIVEIIAKRFGLYQVVLEKFYENLVSSGFWI